MAKKRTKKSTMKKTDGNPLLVDVVKTRTPDRVSVSVSTKQPSTVDRYLNHDIFFALESNVQDGEKPEDALGRVETLVRDQFESRLTGILEQFDEIAAERISQRPKR